MKKILLFSLVLIMASACSSAKNDSDSINKSLEKKLGQSEIIENINQSNNKKMTETKSTTYPDLTKEYHYAILKTNFGEIKLAFYADESPATVNNFLNLAKDGFYNGTRFHRIIKDFMIQGGDPKSKDIAQKNMWGTGDPGYKFNDEFNDNKLVRGSLAMANSGPNTNGSQFFIVTAESTPWLDGKHTNFGFVSEGIEVMEKIEASETDGRDCPLEDVIIESVELVK